MLDFLHERFNLIVSARYMCIEFSSCVMYNFQRGKVRQKYTDNNKSVCATSRKD